MLSKIDITKFNTLIETSALINSKYADLNSLLTQIMTSATNLCGAEASSLLLLNRETQELHFEVSIGAARAKTKRFTVKIGEGVAGWVALHNKSIILNETENKNPRRQKISTDLNNPYKTVIAVPMRVKGECLGVIELINKKNGKTFNREDLDWLEIFANQAGIAVTNVRSAEKAQNKIDQLLSGKGYNLIVAKSPVIIEKLQIVEQVAKTDSSVLILGESGVGKEFFAEQIHLKSNRSEKPIVKIDCAVIPQGLLESELFGNIKGAFESTTAARLGRFELADGGTIFLDEIAELPLALQSKLLKVIQEKTFEKAGLDTAINVDVRILAATNRDIEKLVEKGEFRSDLYHRLNVLPICIPPLRQRPEDIPDLADIFLQRNMKETKKHFAGFSQKAMKELLSYSWPGNIRELANCIERACVTGKGQYIEAEDLFLKPQFNITGAGSRNLKNAENAFRARYIRQVLEENNWNQTESARELGIQRTYLSRLIKELDINNIKE